MKKTGVKILVLICILSMLCSPFGVCATQTDPISEDGAVSESADPSVVSGSHSVDGVLPMLGTARIVENVDAAIVFERESETLLYAWNPDTPMDPASLVKIMTALIAIQNGNLDNAVTVTEEVLATVPEDAVSADLQAGEVMTLQDLLYCMMVESANDACAVIADHVMGSQDAFVEEMNRLAKEMGCTGTSFMNVHGLYHEQQCITARDAARILSEAMKLETFRTIFGALAYTVPATNLSEARELETGNFLMSNNSMEIYYDSRATGGRTGVAKDGTRCLATSAEVNGLQLVCVVLGADSVVADDGYTVLEFGSYKETSALLDAAAGYKRAQILYENQAIRQIAVENGDASVTLAPKVSVSTVLPETVKSADLSYRYVDAVGFAAPIQKGSHLSYLQVWYGNICVAQAELFAMNDVNLKVALQPQDTGSSNGSNVWRTVLTVLGIVLIAVLVIFVIIRLSAKVRMAAMKNRSRRYRRDRRRSR